MSKFTDAVRETFAMPRALSEAVAGALFGPESQSRVRYINEFPAARIRNLEAVLEFERAEHARLLAENRELRATIAATRTELEAALRHLRGC